MNEEIPGQMPEPQTLMQQVRAVWRAALDSGSNEKKIAYLDEVAQFRLDLDRALTEAGYNTAEKFLTLEYHELLGSTPFGTDTPNAAAQELIQEKIKGFLINFAEKYELGEIPELNEKND